MVKLEQRRADQRRRILDAAERLFEGRSPVDVTMSEIAAEAAVARTTVFNHFGSKHALIEGITENVLSNYYQICENALADRRTPTAVLVRAMFEFMGMGISAQPRFFRAVFREVNRARLGLEEGGPGERANAAAHDRLVALFTRGQARDEITRDLRPEDLAWAFDSLGNGTITHWLYQDDSEPLHERMRQAAAILLGEVSTQLAEDYVGPAPDLLPEEPGVPPHSRPRAMHRRGRR